MSGCNSSNSCPQLSPWETEAEKKREFAAYDRLPPGPELGSDTALGREVAVAGRP